MVETNTDLQTRWFSTAKRVAALRVERERRFAVDVDGFYGRQSRKACIALQREMGLEPDGIVGRATWNATFDTSP